MDYKKLITLAASSALLIQTALPSFAATELILSGNGSDSESAIEIGQQTTTTVVQTNTTQVDNKININTNTGDNKAEDNTGGGVYIETGDVDAKVEVTNQLNTNVAQVENCGNCGGDTSVLIEGNGTGTENYVGLANQNAVQVFQDNYAKVGNDVELDLETGNNEADDNTGGDVIVSTGDIDTIVKLSTTANANTAYVAGSGEGGSVDLIVKGNGSDSDNSIELGLTRSTLLAQTNVTDIDNDVDVEAGTGDNDAKDNTGGEVGIGTGDIDVKVMVDNMAGFNHAYIDDCCFDDIYGKVANNGTDSDNNIAAKLDQGMELFQDNGCGDQCHLDAGLTFGQVFPRFWDNDCFDNDLDIDAYTGDNEVEDSTGEGDSDPMVITGDSDIKVEVENAGGSNTYGNYTPEMGGGEGFNFDFEFSFSLSDLLAALLG